MNLTIFSLMDSFNRACGGYTNRYRLLADSSEQLALYKAVGNLDENISGWLEPECMHAFLLGHIEGYAAASRRAR